MNGHSYYEVWILILSCFIMAEAVNECASQPCMHGGTCTENGDNISYTCTCASPFYGPHCQNTCDSGQPGGATAPCVRGSCKNAPGQDGECDCTGTGWTGSTCNTVFFCSSSGPNPCANSNSCTNLKLNSFPTDQNPIIDYGQGYCGTQTVVNGHVIYTCTGNWRGTYCNITLSFCSANPSYCLHGGACVEPDCNALVGTFWGAYGTATVGCGLALGTCVNCTLGWQGTRCNISNACTSSPCLNGGTCVFDGNDLFHCSCEPGYSGRLCQSDIDECASQPCRPFPVADNTFNPTVCLDGINSYTCDCIGSYMTGANCQTVISQCASSNPCLHGGTCVEAFNGHVSGCTCPPGFAWSTICDPCPANTFSTNTGDTSCLSCESGMYQPLTGQTSCITQLLSSTATTTIENSSSSASAAEAQTTSPSIAAPTSTIVLSDAEIIGITVAVISAIALVAGGLWILYILSPPPSPHPQTTTTTTISLPQSTNWDASSEQTPLFIHS